MSTVATRRNNLWRGSSSHQQPRAFHPTPVGFLRRLILINDLRLAFRFPRFARILTHFEKWVLRESGQPFLRWLVIFAIFFSYRYQQFTEDEPAFKKLCTMLIQRCPNLEELTIDGFSSVPTDIQCLVVGRWPRLRKLSLGDVCMDWFPRNPGEKRPFISFLEAHPSLEHLTLSRHAIQPIHFTSLEAGSLSKVTTFSGTHQQLHSLPHLHRSLRSVTFRDPIDTRDVSATTVATLLRDLTSLTSLKVSFTLHSMYDSANLLQSLIQSCPMLRHLELTCGHKPSFQLVCAYLTYQVDFN